MVHAPQLNRRNPMAQQVIQAEMNALVSGVCIQCGDTLKAGKSIGGHCGWCLHLSHVYRPLS